MVVGLSIFLIHKVGIVRTDQFDTIFSSQFDQNLIGLLLKREGLAIGTLVRICHLMALKLQIIVVAPEPLMPLDGFTCPGYIATKDLCRHLACNTGRTDNQVFMILLQFCPVSTRSVIKAVYPRITDQFDQVLIAISVFRQNNQVITAKIILRLFQMHIPTTGHIHLTAEDWLEGFEAVFLALLVNAIADVVKFLNTKHIAMIRDGHTFHTVGNCFIYKPFDTRLSIED